MFGTTNEDFGISSSAAFVEPEDLPGAVPVAPVAAVAAKNVPKRARAQAITILGKQIRGDFIIWNWQFTMDLVSPE